MKFEYWKSKRHWYWHLKARNGEIIAYGEGYRRKIDVLRTIRLIRESDLEDAAHIQIDSKDAS